MRIGMLKGGGQYGALRLHTDQLSAALRGQGHEVAVVDLADMDGLSSLYGLLEAGTDAFLSFGGIGADLRTPQDQWLFDLNSAVFVQIHVDHPVHARDRLSVNLSRTGAFFLDRSHVEFVQAWPATKHLLFAGFLPPGANQLEVPSDASDEQFERRDIPLLFTGTYRGEPQRRWRDQSDGALRNLLDAIAARMEADASLPILEAVRGVMEGIGRPLTPELLSAFAPALADIQGFAEAHHRNRLLHALGEHGVEVEVHGKGWSELSERYPSFSWKGEGSFRETLVLLRRARVVLNVNNGFLDGGHERVFAAMAGGAGVLTDASGYYRDAFDRSEIAMFNWDALPSVPEQLDRLQADPIELAAMARAGQRRVLAEHGWDRRADALAKVISPLI